MTAPLARSDRDSPENDEISLLVIGSVLLRWRRTIIAMSLLGAAIGLAIGLTSRRMYMSGATFIPQGSEGVSSGFALAASQFGIALPSGGAAWQPPVYVELLRSQTLLERIALDTVSVAEQNGRRVAVLDLLDIDASGRARRVDLAVRALRDLIQATEDKKLGAVKLSVTTELPSVSFALAERLVQGVNRFNLEARKSQAAAERQFVEEQARQAEKALRDAEDRLELFLQRNRTIAGSPDLAFQRDRLERAVVLRQQVYSSLMQSREEARIREVRDTPVITVLEEPRLPTFGEPRRLLLKGVLGGLVGAVLGMLVAFVGREVVSARRSAHEEAREFFQLLQEATPRLAKRRSRS